MMNYNFGWANAPKLGVASNVVRHGRREQSVLNRELYDALSELENGQPGCVKSWVGRVPPRYPVYPVEYRNPHFGVNFTATVGAALMEVTFPLKNYDVWIFHCGGAVVADDSFYKEACHAAFVPEGDEQRYVHYTYDSGVQCNVPVTYKFGDAGEKHMQFYCEKGVELAEFLDIVLDSDIKGIVSAQSTNPELYGPVDSGVQG
jgi:hypothetical protein